MGPLYDYNLFQLNSAVAHSLLRHRVLNDMTQRHLAETIGYSVQLVQSAEKLCANLDIETMSDILAKIGVGINEIVSFARKTDEMRSENAPKAHQSAGGVIQLGSFFLDGLIRPRPTKPYYGTPEHADGAGNIPRFKHGSIEIRDTDSSEENRVQWVEVIDSDKRLLICDRVLLVSISWDDLNEQGLISGKEISIDGNKHLLRVLSGGEKPQDNDDWCAGASPANEWDRYIGNAGDLPNLLTPEASDLEWTPEAINGEHNRLWNWHSIFSWCKDTSAMYAANRAIRGYYSARYWNVDTASYRDSSRGWRPCLEVLPSANSEL